MTNLLSGLPRNLPEELVETLARGEDVRIERIVSTGHASPDGFWYDQDQSEWVAVLSGEARLRFQGDAQAIRMRPGDYVNIPAHRKHRVEWTSPDTATVWLAIFYQE